MTSSYGKNALWLLSFLILSCSGGEFAGNGNQGQAGSPQISGSGDSIGLPSGSPSTTGGNPNPIPAADVVAALQKKCEAASPATLKVMEQTLKYPERKSCSFGVAPNLERKDKSVQAAETSKGTLNLPAGDICGIAIQSPAAQLRYDDFLILSLDTRIIFLSNSGLASYLDAPQQGIQTWDFNKVVGKAIQNFEAPAFCLGKGADCVLPGHDKQGPVALNLKPAAIAPIAASLKGKTAAALDLTATGDDNDSDCGHTALEVAVKIEYLAP